MLTDGGQLVVAVVDGPRKVRFGTKQSAGKEKASCCHGESFVFLVWDDVEDTAMIQGRYQRSGLVLMSFVANINLAPVLILILSCCFALFFIYIIIYIH